MKYFFNSGLNLFLAVTMFFNYAGFGYAADLPQVSGVVAGTVQFNQPNADTLNITASNKSIIDYNEFNIGASKTVNFIQPSSSSVALNRVIGSNPSSIYGALNANGRIFLINPNGVLFAPGSQVNVGGLVASSMNISNADFISGKYGFNRNGANGSVVNEGQITIANGGYVALLAPEVRNTGSVQAQLGTIVLASGNAATLHLDDLGDVSVVVDPGQITGISNSGTLKADGGKIILTAKTLDNVLDHAINNTGLIQANKLSSKNGAIYLTANDRVVVGGEISADTGTLNVDSQGANYFGKMTVKTARLDANDGDTFIHGVFTGNYIATDNINLFVDGDLTVTGNITLTADADNSGNGSFVQIGATTITGSTITISGADVIVGNLATNGCAIKVTATQGDINHSIKSMVTTKNGTFQGNAKRDYILNNGSAIDTGSGKIDILAGRDIYLGKGPANNVYYYNWKALAADRGYKFIELGYFKDGVFYVLSQGADIGKDGKAVTSGSGYVALNSANIGLYGIFDNLGETSSSRSTFYSDASMNADGLVHVKNTSGTIYGFEDKIKGSDWDFNDAVIDMSLSSVSMSAGATLRTTHDGFLTAVGGGIHQNGGILNVANLILWTNTGMEGIGANGGLLVDTNCFSAFNKTSGDIRIDDKGDSILYNKMGHIGLNVGGLEGMSTSTTKITGTDGVVNKAVGGKIDIIEERNLTINNRIIGRGDIIIKAGGAISQAAAGVITIDQIDTALLNAPKDVRSTSHNTDTWEFGVSNDNTVDVAWELPDSIAAKYDYTATAGTSYTMNAGSSVKTNGGDATVTAKNNVAVTLIDAGTGNVKVTSTSGAIVDNNAASTNLIGRTIVMSAATGSTADIEIAAPTGLGFSFTWDLLAAGTVDAIADSGYATTFSGGTWHYTMTSPVLPDGTNNYFHIATVSGASKSATVDLGAFYIDTIKPIVTGSVTTGSLNGDGSYLPDATVSFDATDNLSGFAPGGATSVTGFDAKTTSGLGAQALTSTSICDQAGNCNTGALPITIHDLLTITADSDSKVYGETYTYGAPGFTVTGGTLYGGYSVTSTTLTSAGTAATATVAGGPYAIIPSAAVGTGLENYIITYANGTLTVTPKSITVTADAKTKVYGDADPALTYTGALLGTDTFSGSLARVAGEDVVAGGYAINQGTLSAGSNYTISYVGDSLVITPKGVTVTADAKTKVYGDADPALTYTGALLGTDTFSGSLARVVGEDVVAGGYAINQGTLSAGSNYTISYVGDSLVITPKGVTVTADDQTKMYGVTLNLGTTAFTASGLIAGDSITAVTLVSAGAVNTAVAGSYAITPSAAIGSGVSNYNINYINGNLTVDPVVTPNGLTAPLLAQKFLYPHVEQLSQKQINPMDLITSAALMITGQPFFYQPLTPVDDGAYNGFQLEEGAYDFIDGQVTPCDPTGKGENPCKQ